MGPANVTVNYLQALPLHAIQLLSELHTLTNWRV